MKKSIVPEKNKPLLKYSIVQINLSKKNLDTSGHLEYESLKKEFLFEADVNLLHDKSIIQILATYKFFADTKLVLDMEVENDFRIENFSDAVQDKKVADQEFLIFLIELSIGHLRGVQATVIKGTPISKYYIPYI